VSIVLCARGHVLLHLCELASGFFHLVTIGMAGSGRAFVHRFIAIIVLGSDSQQDGFGLGSFAAEREQFAGLSLQLAAAIDDAQLEQLGLALEVLDPVLAVLDEGAASVEMSARLRTPHLYLGTFYARNPLLCG